MFRRTDDFSFRIRVEDLTSLLPTHDLQTLQAKTKFLNISVEPCWGFEQGGQNGDFAWEVRQF
jgi:hypothetical protein